MNTDLPLTMAGPMALNSSSLMTRWPNDGPQRLGRDVDAGDGLAVGLLDVVFQRHRGRADVGAQLHRFLGAAAAQLGQVEAIADAADQVAAQHLDALLVLEEAERFLDDLERQAQQPGQVQAEHAAARVEGAQDQVVEEAERQAGLLAAFPGRWAPRASRRRPSPCCWS